MRGEREEKLNAVKGILLRDHVQDPRVADTLKGYADSKGEARPEPTDVPPESSPETPDVAPESSPEQDVPQESSPEEQAQPQEEKPDDKELNFRKLREERDNERLRRETLELELTKLKREQLEALDKKLNEDRLKQIDTYLNERLPDNFEEMDEREKYRTIGRIAASVKADEEFGGRDELRQMANEWQVLKHVPDLRGEQVTMVAQILDSAKGALQPQEALAVARARAPEMFSAPEPPAAPSATVPVAQQVTPPSREGRGRIPPNELQQLQEDYYQAAMAGDAYTKRSALTALVRHKLGQHPGVLPGR